LALRRNLVASLFEHETISTTIAKAKDSRSFAEKMITLAKQGTLTARRRAIAMLGDRDIIKDEDGLPVRKGTIIRKLFSELGPRYLDRSGGYTRIIRLSMNRLGDNGQLVLLQLIGPDEKPTKKTRTAVKKGTRKKVKRTAEVKKAEQTQEEIKASQAVETAETSGTSDRKDESSQ
jgi:large subunit ribosomal protein L17